MVVQVAALGLTDVLIATLDLPLGHALAWVVTTGPVTVATFSANRRFSFPPPTATSQPA